MESGERGRGKSQCKGIKSCLSCLCKSKKANVARLLEAGDVYKEMRSDWKVGGECTMT